ncbi:class I SAM-dependent methyltransferase [Sorangium sp. So ce1000]|uniref:class I SAM-dependent methyltransferase n=1 Tax=Sorangium sp. So ce1000 TaxID=3133325 RepID=UPI003F63C784
MNGTFLDLRSLRAQLLAWHTSEEPLDDSAIDRLLDLRIESVEAGIVPLKRIVQFPDECSTYEGASYASIRRFYRWAAPRPGDVVYDLGAGYGRVLLYGGLICQATLRGVELIAARVDEANRVRARLNLDAVELRQGNARDADFGDGTVFFIHSFSLGDAINDVGRRLRDLSAVRPLRIASMAQTNDYFAGCAWLSEIAAPHEASMPLLRYGLRFFVTRGG